MAKGVQIPIEVVDKFSEQLRNMERRLDDITKAADRQSKGFQLLSADILIRYGREAGNAVIQFGKDAVKAFEDQETANRRLQAAMQNLGVYTEAAYLRQLRFAESMQDSTTFADEQVVELQATLTTFGLYGTQLEKVTKSALDLAAAQRIDLNQAAMLLGKAFVGETGTLSRYGIVVDDAGSRVQKFGAVMEQIEKRFGGRAAAEIDTHAGHIKQLANAYSDLQEKIGEDLVRSSDGAVSALAKLAKAANANYDTIKALFSFSDASVEKVIAGIVSWGGKVGILTGEQQKLYDILLKVREAANTPAGGPKAARTPDMPVDSEAIRRQKELEETALIEDFALAERSRKWLEERVFTSSQIKDIEAERLAAELEAEGQNEAAKEVLRVRGLERDKQINVERITATRNMLSQLAALQQAKTKEIAAIGKAAAFAQAVINAHLAATQAMAAFAAIPPLAIAMGALMEAAGMAQAMMIAGVPLKEGGIAHPKPGGVMVNAAENGEPEVISPLWKLKSMLGLDEGGFRGRGMTQVSFGDINVTVQANDVGSQADRRSLAEQLVEELRRKAAPAIEASLLVVQTAGQYPARAV